MNDYHADHGQSPYGYPPDPDEGAPKKTQSKLGIASFVIGLLSLILFAVAIVMTTTFIMDQFGNESNYNQLRADLETRFSDVNAVMPVLVAGLLMLVSFAGSLVGLILGIVGACSKNKTKTFPIIGIIVSALLPVGFVGLIVLGLALGGTAS
ncbi:hypothetical protein I8J29_13780 [Paenibacillus sp. MWE-103]|uniref:DUF4064 domain-containing protein n=1 Tax=Paenibacillus artemisiicola TaxID=1172618 RepID=A0ABS3WAC0_9BACL|nr:hypothetical protein [Paenibacillus artemisiicola]MBO7745276.1 hypothetical protein [Paenibacillus artemisiicola]